MPPTVQLQIYEIRKSGTIDNIKMNEGEDAKTDSTIFLLQLKIENKPIAIENWK